jgi:hypothetical protein
MIKVYFILVLYSFSIHLRRGTFKSLPISNSFSFSSENSSGKSNQRTYRYQHLRTTSTATTTDLGGDEEEDLDVDNTWKGGQKVQIPTIHLSKPSISSNS